MGKPTGFLEYERRLPPDREARERLGDWEDFHGRLPAEAAREQGARCLDCGTPFCHSGMLLAGMASGCPLNNLIPEWNDLIYQGLWREAVERLLMTNPFPEFTSLVCPAPCEGSCTLGQNASPVTIRQNERVLIERAFAEGWIQARPPASRTGKKVAVIGSGPAGLACAERLNALGHWVTIFERADRPGGLLMYGIPQMKLDKKIVERRVKLMQAAGVQFVLGTEAGEDYPADKLRAEFEALVLCGGARKPRDLQIEGRELKGIHFALDFLMANTKSLLDSKHRDGRYTSAKDQEVLVIGGGDTGTDCVATALRHGCRSVAQFEIVPCPPEGRAADNPWPQWPKVYKLDYGQEEAAAVQGRDPRIYSIQTKRFLGDDLGYVKAVQTVQVEWVPVNGRLTPIEVPGTERIRSATLVLLALGFLGPEDALLDRLGVARDSRSNARAAEGSYATSIPGVFAAGDMRRGQSLVVWAMREGREAALAVDRYLMAAEEEDEEAINE